MPKSSEVAQRSAPDSDDDSRMTLSDHLIELRRRLLISVAAIAIGTVLAFIYFHPIYDLMTQPYCKLPQSRPFRSSSCALFTQNVLAGFQVRLKVAMIAGVMGSGPIWLYQLWAFIAPGLHRKEKRWGVWFIATAFALFLAGGVFAYFTLDKGLDFLFRIGGNGIQPLLSVDSYFNFLALMLAAFGVSFLFPLVLVILNMAGVLSTARMRSSRRIVAFLVAFFAAVITPSQDPFTFTAMAVPMYAFYESAIVFGRLRDRRILRRAARDPLSQLGDDETSVIDERPSSIDEHPSLIDDRPSRLDGPDDE